MQHNTIFLVFLSPILIYISIIFAPSTLIVTISDCSSLRYIALLGYVLLFHSVPAKRFTTSIQNHCTDSTLYTYSTLSTWKTEGHENSQAITPENKKNKTKVGTSLFCFVKVPTFGDVLFRDI